MNSAKRKTKNCVCAQSQRWFKDLNNQCPSGTFFFLYDVYKFKSMPANKILALEAALTDNNESDINSIKLAHYYYYYYCYFMFVIWLKGTGLMKNV